MKKYLGLVLLVVLVSCKSKKALVGQTNESQQESNAEIIDKHNTINRDFNTLYIKSSAKYQDENNTQNVTAEIRIKKDEKILISVRFLGITMAKALITPTSVQYYEKINNTYFEGNFEGLTKWLGTDLDYSKIQNLLIGKALDDLTKQNYSLSKENDLNKLYCISPKEIKKSFWFENSSAFIKKQEIEQPQSNRFFQVFYTSYKDNSSAILPEEFNIETNVENKQTSIQIEYKNVNINEEMNFPYSVPEGYKRIFIN